MINYIERYIISGSAVEIEKFVEASIPGSKDMFLGLLQSAFILGFSIACIIFGYFVSLESPFLIVCIGLILWTIATLISGLAWNYWILLCGRLLSGVGEAAFQIVVPAFIDDYSSKDHVGTSMSRLYMAIPVGTAIGYSLSGFISEYYSWRATFIITGPLMIPFILILFYYPLESLKDLKLESSPIDPKDQVVIEVTTNDCNGMKQEENADCNEVKHSLSKDIIRMLLTPTFLLATLGEAFAVFISTGFTSFGNIFLVNLHMFESESMSSLTIGVVGCMAGIVGATLGGITLNWVMQLRDSYSNLFNYYSHLTMFCC